VSADRIALVDTLMGHYNRQDADAYAALFVNEGTEANYRGAVLRDGRDGVRDGLRKMFVEFPENRVEVIRQSVFGDTVLMHERVYRSSTAEPFDVMAIYSFRGEQVERVEFIR
jgi:uncharacterized protein (TIGR02246 family)